MAKIDENEWEIRVKISDLSECFGGLEVEQMRAKQKNAELDEMSEYTVDNGKIVKCG